MIYYYLAFISFNLWQVYLARTFLWLPGGLVRSGMMVERARYEPVYGHRDGWPIGPVQMLNKKKKEKTLL